MGCFNSKARRQFPGQQDPVVLASQTAFTVSEVQALFELFKSISSSIVDEGLISKEDLGLGLLTEKLKNHGFSESVSVSGTVDEEVGGFNLDSAGHLGRR